MVAEGVDGRAVFGCSASQRLSHRQAEQSRNTPTQSNDPPPIMYPFSWNHIRFALEMTHAVYAVSIVLLTVDGIYQTSVYLCEVVR